MDYLALEFDPVHALKMLQLFSLLRVADRRELVLEFVQASRLLQLLSPPQAVTTDCLLAVFLL